MCSPQFCSEQLCLESAHDIEVYISPASPTLHSLVHSLTHSLILNGKTNSQTRQWVFSTAHSSLGNVRTPPKQMSTIYP